MLSYETIQHTIQIGKVHMLQVISFSFVVFRFVPFKHQLRVELQKNKYTHKHTNLAQVRGAHCFRLAFVFASICALDSSFWRNFPTDQNYFYRMYWKSFALSETNYFSRERYIHYWPLAAILTDIYAKLHIYKNSVTESGHNVCKCKRNYVRKWNRKRKIENMQRESICV